ncbi:MAG: hypothetical protein V2A65_00620 [Candidatus Omnitrophota bacterium]
MRKGLTLIEITLTICIIALMSIGIFSIFSGGITTSTETREVSIVIQALQEEMELIRNMSFDSIAVLGTSSFTTPGFDYLTDTAGTVTVDQYGDSNILRVTVTVSWLSAGNRNLSKNLVTLITREGLDKK